MFLKNHTFFFLFLIIIIAGCAQKNSVEEPKEVEEAYTSTFYKVPEGSELSKLNDVIKNVIDYCNGYAIDDKNAPYDALLVKHFKSFIQIDLNTEEDFYHDSYELKEDAKMKLSCVIPFIKAQDSLVLQITGHVDANATDKANKQHLSDDRAITVAEFMYNDGIRHEIFAKGCADKKPKYDYFAQEHNRTLGRIEIFIYANKSNLQDHCK